MIYIKTFQVCDLSYRLQPSQRFIYSQCFQMTLAKNLSDLPYTGGSYIDGFRFPHVPDQKIDPVKH